MTWFFIYLFLNFQAHDISDVIRKTSTTANGGKEAKVVTYEDLLKDPQVMESMKKSLGLFFKLNSS